MTLVAFPAQIDWSHSIARGLTDCFYFGQGFGKNLANNSAPMVSNSGAGFKATIDGPAGACSGGSFFSFPNHGNVVAGDFTIRCRFVTSATPGGTFTNLYAKGAGSAEYRAYLNASNQLSFLSIGASGSLSSPMQFGGVGVTNDFVIARIGLGSPSLFAYLNGLLQFSVASTNTTADAVATQLAVENGGGNTAGSFQYTVFQIWSRGLSQSEVIQLYFDPTLMLKRPKFIAHTTVAASTVFRRTLSSLGTRTGSRQTISP